LTFGGSLIKEFSTDVICDGISHGTLVSIILTLAVKVLVSLPVIRL